MGLLTLGCEDVLRCLLSWLNSALPSSAFELQEKKFLLRERKGSDETFQRFHRQQREMGTVQFKNPPQLLFEKIMSSPGLGSSISTSCK